MRVLVTGGAGFIGRWVVAALRKRGDEVIVLDDLSNGSEANLSEFRRSRGFQFLRGDVADRAMVARAFAGDLDLCIHLAAVIEVQKSLDDPVRTFRVNAEGTANVLEACRAQDVGLTFVSTCMVYDAASATGAISEEHPVKPTSPYASTKLAGEYLALSYHEAYGLPVSILRPFNTYGPFQKSNQEGGVIAVFLGRALAGKPLRVFGDGTQTRDLMHVDDCVDFILRASDESEANGEIINGGTGHDVPIRDLARLIAGPEGTVEHVSHPHPRSEIPRLRCDPTKAAKLLGWKAVVSLEEGILRTRESMSR